MKRMIKNFELAKSMLEKHKSGTPFSFSGRLYQVLNPKAVGCGYSAGIEFDLKLIMAER